MQRQAEGWECFREGRRKASGVLLGAVGLGELEAGTLCDWLQERIWLSLVGLKLETGTKIRKASHD